MKHEKIKRGIDVVGAGVGLLIFSPAFAIIALAVLVVSGRPIFFSQQRVGRRGRVFTMYKFRTMCLAVSGNLVTSAGDRRVTSIGRLLRKSKFDELPQLWNVFHGDMSLVGPRPEVPYYVALYTAEQRRVLEVRPGLTDLASLIYRNEETLLSRFPEPERAYREIVMPQKLSISARYADVATIWSDIEILFCTLWPGLLKFSSSMRQGSALPHELPTLEQ